MCAAFKSTPNTKKWGNVCYLLSLEQLINICDH